MIRRLRIKFALSAIGSALLVLLILVGGINLMNYREVIEYSDRVLDLLEENGGNFPEFIFPERFKDEDNRVSRESRNSDLQSPELAYQTRFFSVIFDEVDNIAVTNTERIKAISPKTAADYAAKVLKGDKSRGFTGDYRYLVTRYKSGQSLVIFCDCGQSLMNFRSFLWASIIFSAGCLLLVSAIAILISGKAVKPVAESYAKQKRFITDAGHEIKTPLAIINADTDVLMADIGEDNEWAQDIKKQTRRLSVLTNELVLLSKMEEGTNSLNFEEIDFSEILRDQTESFKTVAFTTGNELECHIDEHICINGDRDASRRLTSILLDNAVKYCPKGGNIRVDLKKNGKAAILEISNDTAEDINDKDLTNLFDRFYRTDSSRNSSTGGHGIGLSVAKAITEAHGGKIAVKKDATRRIRFLITLPSK